MDYTNSHALVDTAWLAENLDNAEVRAIDATFFLPTVARDASAEFTQCHIPGAVFFDINAVADKNTDLPHMLPDAATFGREVGRLGIGNATNVVVYDVHGGCAAAARLWWTFRLFGHQRVAVLDGGLPKWRREGRATESGTPSPDEKRFAATMNPAMVRGVDDLLANIASRAEQVVDARSAGRFVGADAEPRPAKKAGHIPGSLNLPFNDLMDPDAGVVRPADEIAAAFDGAGVDRSRPIVTTCGSGVTAAFLSFGLYLIGVENAAVYDGSWAEWGNHADTPVET
ncbi:MAG: 3-mercaptopyruvate sulfurtransferase [Rhodospirillales bacterium]|jgi:thiosulfate/3-mercaptopyruvate sulfurtransferase|nr:3-mercaptopyruvate sulfurtransferase [Rhodospirillales bacterium]MDP6884677.1 3-mercaptopyruvate sulfurtransferase [Rhodospirillales bacterium]